MCSFAELHSLFTFRKCISDGFMKNGWALSERKHLANDELWSIRSPRRMPSVDTAMQKSLPVSGWKQQKPKTFAFVWDLLTVVSVPTKNFWAEYFRSRFLINSSNCFFVSRQKSGGKAEIFPHKPIVNNYHGTWSFRRFFIAFWLVWVDRLRISEKNSFSSFGVWHGVKKKLIGSLIYKSAMSCSILDGYWLCCCLQTEVFGDLWRKSSKTQWKVNNADCNVINRPLGASPRVIVAQKKQETLHLLDAQTLRR